jgi:chromosomal replication initiation ATPase DnaA
VANYYGVKAARITTKCRKKTDAEARQTAVYLAAEFTRKTDKEMEKGFKRECSTIWHTRHEVALKLESDSDIKKSVAALRTKIMAATLHERNREV